VCGDDVPAEALKFLLQCVSRRVQTRGGMQVGQRDRPYVYVVKKRACECVLHTRRSGMVASVPDVEGSMVLRVVVL